MDTVIVRLLQVFGPWVLVVFSVLALIVSKFNGKVRKTAYKYIPEAETGSIDDILKDGAYKILDNIQKSDLDDRMAKVMAIVIAQIPFLRMLPLSMIEGYVNNLVQKAFDNVKASLRVVPKEKLEK